MVATRHPESEGKLPREPVPALKTITEARSVLDTLDYEPAEPTFVPLAAGTLGNAATASDGFDVLTLTAAGTVDDDAAAPADLDQHVAAADFIDAQFKADNGTVLATEVQAFKDTGDGLTGEVTTAYGGTPAPQPAPAPTDAPPLTSDGSGSGHAGSGAFGQGQSGTTGYFE